MQYPVAPRSCHTPAWPLAPSLGPAHGPGQVPLPALSPSTRGGEAGGGAGEPKGTSRLPGPGAPFVHLKTQGASEPPAHQGPHSLT